MKRKEKDSVHLLTRGELNKRLLRYAYRQKPLLILVCFLNLIYNLTTLAAPFMVAQVIKLLTDQGVRDWRNQTFWVYVVVIFLLFSLSSLFQYLVGISAAKLSLRLTTQMRHEVFEHLHQMPLSYYDQLPSGKIVARVSSDTKSIQQFYDLMIVHLIPGLLQAIVILGMIAWIGYLLLFLMLPPILMMLIALYDYRRKASLYSDSLRRVNADINASINENLSNMEAIQGLGVEDNSYQHFEQINQKHYQIDRNWVILEAYNGHNIQHTVRCLSTLFILIFFSLSFLYKWSFAPVAYLFLAFSYSERFFGFVQRISYSLSQLERCYGAARHFFELLEMPCEVELVQEEVSYHPERSDSLRFEQVDFSYLPDKQILHQLTFSLPKGKTLAVVGDTGSGKTTIINLLLRFYEAQSGTIEVEGVRIDELSRAQLRSEIALVQQDPFLYSGTVLDNIRMGNLAVTEEQACQALEHLGAGFLLKRLDKGILTEVKEGGKPFSSGERQLITFARAFVKNAPILLLDEATSHVDTETEALIQQAMFTLMSGRSTLIIAHRLSTIQHADEIILLKEGRIVEQGNHEQLMKLNGHYRAMVEAQTLIASKV